MNVGCETIVLYGNGGLKNIIIIVKNDHLSHIPYFKIHRRLGLVEFSQAID